MSPQKKKNEYRNSITAGKKHILEQIYAFFGDSMKRMVGFTLFWIAVGMLIMLFLHNAFIGAIIIALLLLVGYNLFC